MNVSIRSCSKTLEVRRRFAQDIANVVAGLRAK